MSKTSSYNKSLGPGLVFEGAAIGVSHPGAIYKSGSTIRIWIGLGHFIGQPFKISLFLFGPLLVKKTNKNLIEGYASMENGRSSYISSLIW